MRDLVAVVASGAAFVDRLLAAWDAGDAVLPVDPRLPPAAVRNLLDALRAGQPVEEDDALVVATSGTTGEPKGVVLTHHAVMASAMATSARLAVDAEHDTWLACIPLAHVGGLSVVTRALRLGTRLVVHDAFDAEAVTASVEREGVTLVSLVPTALARINPAAFRTILLGGAAPLEPLATNVISTYGLTETGSGVIYNGVPLDGVDVRIDPTTNEVSVRGPMLLRAYRDGHDPKDSDGWFATGDSGHLDGAGRLVVDGRLSEMIITGGENVWPAAVEAALATHPAIAEARVSGVPDPEWGQRVVATVVLADGHDAPALNALRDSLRDRLPAFALPRQLDIVPELDRTPSGKLKRPPAR